MRLRRTLRAVATAVLAVVFVVAAFWWRGASPQARSDQQRVAGPLRGAKLVGLGVVKPGPVTSTAIIENVGDSPVRLYGIQTSCGCVEAGFLGDEPGPLAPEFVVQPGRSARLLLSFHITNKQSHFRTHLHVRTDHPDVPVWDLEAEAVVRLGLTTDPAELALGRLTPGEVRDVELMVRDDTGLGAVRPDVSTSDPGQIEIVGFTPTGPAHPAAAEDHVGTLHIRFHAPQQPTEVVGWIAVKDPGRPEAVCQVRLTGAVRSEYELSPGSLRLSRKSGPPAGTFFVRNTAGTKFRLETVDPFPWAVELNPTGGMPTAQLVRLSAGPAAACFLLTPGRYSVTLRAVTESGDSTLIAVPVTLVD